MFLKKVLPLLTIGMKVLSTAAKIAGTAIGAGGLVPNGDVLKTLGIVSKKSGDIATLLQQVKRCYWLNKMNIGIGMLAPNEKSCEITKLTSLDHL